MHANFWGNSTSSIAAALYADALSIVKDFCRIEMGYL